VLTAEEELSDKIRAMALILASASSRRQELMRNAGIAFTVQPTNIPEVLGDGECPRVSAERLAREKALAIFRQQANAFVLGADTIVIIDEQILGKPRDRDDAARMLRILSGRTHQVTTGVCLVGPQTRVGSGAPASFEDVRSETTLVTMSTLTDDDIRSYICTGEPMDKAGAYAIQGIASRWIPRIEGDYFNVVGLPVSLVYRMIREHAVL
jgi:septum formation protein